jgi:transposase
MWAVVAPLIPAPKARPQGGGRSRVGDRAVFVAVVYVLTSGCAWRRLPPSFGIAVPTAYRRFVEWNRVRLWDNLHDAIAGQRVGQGTKEDSLAAWTRSIKDAARARAAFTT